MIQRRGLDEADYRGERFKDKPGQLKGMGKFDESFFDPLPEEELRLWEGRGD